MQSPAKQVLTTADSRLVNYYSEKSTGRLQKIPIDAGFSCPNRDGTLSREGCLFCSNKSFSPFYCTPEKTITQQLNEGISFFSQRYKCDGFYAYFQSYSCTNAPVEKLSELYNEALSVKNINGLVIATRPDCLNDKVISLLKNIRKHHYLRLEIGIESCNDSILTSINRCHMVKDSMKAIRMAAEAGIEVCGHIILGLPQETIESQVHGARMISSTGLSFIKLHHLQIVKGAKFADKYLASPNSFRLYSIDDYIEILSLFIANLSPSILIERLINRVPPTDLLAPIWNGINETQARERLFQLMQKKGYSQGCKL